MSQANLGLLFTKKYYRNIDWQAGDKDEKNEDQFKESNRVLLGQEFSHAPYAYPSSPYQFEATTTYPGLLLGSGYAHGSNRLGEIKIGFYFDHTTGLPIIPGSSIKGLLRSVFPEKYSEEGKKLMQQALKAQKVNKMEQVVKLAKAAEKSLKLAQERTGYLKYLLTERVEVPIHNINEAWLCRLEQEIFNGHVPSNSLDNTSSTKEPAWKPIPIYDRDIFHDAILVKCAHPPLWNPNNKREGGIIGTDFITPHHKKEEADKENKPNSVPATLKNPIPLSFIKVLPNSTFRFQFQLKETYLSPAGRQKRLLSPTQRLELFQAIIMDLGIGAKTNVGYGQLV